MQLATPNLPVTIATGHVTQRGTKRYSGFTHVCPMGVGNAHEWYTQGFVRFYSARLDKYITVEPWFIHDMASIPKALHSLVSDDGYERFAAVVHDWLCVTAEIPRNEADKVFREACEVTGTSRLKIPVMYRAVRSYSVTFGRNQTENRLLTEPGKHFVNPDAPPIVNRRKVSYMVF